MISLLLGILPNKPTGEDKLSVKLVKRAVPLFGESLATIFNKSIATGVFKNDWKTSKVTPLYKNSQRMI